MKPDRPSGFGLADYLETRSRMVVSEIEACLSKERGETRLQEAMRHSLSSGGKRIRPILCLAAAEAVGGDPARALPAAVALEMIHTYSLIHDDLPAMDDDDMRRGKPTCHVAFDEATAILAGDALLTLGFQVLAEAGLGASAEPGKWLEVVRIVADAAGREGMVEGQMRDIAAEGNRLELSELEALHRLKTGRMIEASVHAGALLGGGSEAEVASLRAYARSVGLAFQIMDDILNVEGDPELLGKGVGTDAAREKTTYPALLGLDRSKRLASRQVEEALQFIRFFDKKSDPLRAIARFVIDRNR